MHASDIGAAAECTSGERDQQMQDLSKAISRPRWGRLAVQLMQGDAPPIEPRPQWMIDSTTMHCLMAVHHLQLVRVGD